MVLHTFVKYVISVMSLLFIANSNLVLQNWRTGHWNRKYSACFSL